MRVVAATLWDPGINPVRTYHHEGRVTLYVRTALDTARAYTHLTQAGITCTRAGRAYITLT